MDARHRFADAVGGSDADVRLDVAALCIAAHAHPGVDVDAWCGRLDDLAAGCPEASFDALRRHLFAVEAFTGNRDDYGDPENSFLDSVLTRHVGIPITLSVVTMEVGRRLGLDVRGIGMPGHFMVQDASRREVWCDPFHGGRLYSAEDCRALFSQLHGDATPFHPSYLSPTPAHTIIARMLTNLEHGRLAHDPVQLAWMCELHLALPGLDDAERKRLYVATRTARARWN
jgi:regulator of sirC expression with transglutaminase-like and TPR domain